MKNIGEMCAVMLHFNDGGRVECKYLNREWAMTTDPKWDWAACDYRIAKEKRTVKFEAWVDTSGGLHLYEEGKLSHKQWKRVPSLDLTGEVEE
jgi:hypothetical protein